MWPAGARREVPRIGQSVTFGLAYGTPGSAELLGLASGLSPKSGVLAERRLKRLSKYSDFAQDVPCGAGHLAATWPASS
jgi:hypothetical protein